MATFKRPGLTEDEVRRIAQKNGPGYDVSNVNVYADKNGSAALSLPLTTGSSAGSQYRAIDNAQKNPYSGVVSVPIVDTGSEGIFETPIISIPTTTEKKNQLNKTFSPAYVTGANNYQTYKTGNKQNTTNNGGGSRGGSGNGSGGSSGGSTAAVPDYQGMLDDLYNKVMGYGGFTASSYTPSVYTKTVDTTDVENQLKGWLNEIDNYDAFSYDLNGDLLYRQMADNYIQQGQLAMQDAMGQAAALTGGYGNSYASAVGNQAYQQYLTQLNNNLPELQQQALNVWQAGYDQLLNQYNAGSAHLDDLLALEQNYFDIWNANEQNAFNAWNANQQMAFNAWQAGYNQLMDQYNLGVDYITQLQALQAQNSGGGSSSGSSTKNNTQTTEKTPAASVAAGLLAGLGANATVTNPLTSDYYKQLAELLKK